MIIFNRQLIKRIESIEEELGIAWTVDRDGYGEHVEINDGYGLVPRIKRTIDKLEEGEN